MQPSIILNFLNILSQFKLLHWQTSKYSRHIAYGETYDILNTQVDAFVEIYMGKYGRPVLSEKDIIILSNIGELEIDEYLNFVVSYLLDFNNKLDEVKDSDLLNLRDEMLSQINKLKYLITLD